MAAYQKREYLHKMFANYFGNFDCVKTEDGFHLISWNTDINNSKINILIEAIVQDGYDLEGFWIDDIPHPDIFNFFKDGHQKESFSMLYTEGRWVPSYIARNKETHIFEQKIAASIKEAIELDESPL